MAAEKIELQFGNDMSRIVRGIAIIMMVTNHCYPGKIIPFAVPLFTFLVGYGYAFARQRNYLHSLKRVWHLLSGFWIILFGICVPVAIFYTHYKFELRQLALNMFGLWPGFNFYCWYIYFYIFAMALMPLLSRVVDRFGLAGALVLVALFGGAYFAIPHLTASKHFLVGDLRRCCQWMPLLIAAYYLASRRIYSLLRYHPGWKSALIALTVMIATYLLRYYEAIRTADLITVPIFTGATAMLFHSVRMKWVSVILTELGLKSMNIWFLHALFFTFSTRKLFLPLISWAAWPPLRILAVLAISYMMAVLVDLIRKHASRLLIALYRRIHPASRKHHPSGE